MRGPDQPSVYEQVFAVLVASSANPCDAVSDAIQAAADFAAWEKTHWDAKGFAAESWRRYQIAMFKPMKASK